MELVTMTKSLPDTIMDLTDMGYEPDTYMITIR